MMPCTTRSVTGLPKKGTFPPIRKQPPDSEEVHGSCHLASTVPENQRTPH